ncbi:putative coiled-coil protein SlyX [Flavobacterium sp. W4I14]|nr:putative coiled-coil protein SlyX [Flavobacterium sp. W4I14]
MIVCQKTKLGLVLLFSLDTPAEMPSAKEIEANGLGVGERLRLQQKKIEELTLHLIDKDKQLNAQGGQVTKLEEKLAKQDKILQEILKKLK